MKVLIVEDEALLAMALERIVQKLGHSCVGKVSDGEEVGQRCAQERPDVVFLDIRLRGKMTGLDAARYIRVAFPGLAFAFMTAYSTDEVVHEAKALDPVAFAEKPVSIETIRRILEAVAVRMA